MPPKLAVPSALVGSLAMALLLLVARPSAPASADPALDPEEQTFVTLINNYRASNGLAPLTIDWEMQASSDWMSADMGINSYFDHNDVCIVTATSDCLTGHATDGLAHRDPWTRMCAFGYCYSTWKGENIAAGYTTAQSVFTAWQNSPGHNANMLGSHYTAMGISRVYTPGSPYSWYWTNDFGGVNSNASPPPGSTVTPAPSPTRSPSPTPSPSRTSSQTPTPTPTPKPTATPPATATPTPTPTPRPTNSPPPPLPVSSSPSPIPARTPIPVHDVAVSFFGVQNEAHAGDTKAITIRIVNLGTVTEAKVQFGISAACLDGNGDKVLECGSLSYSPACFGTVGPLAPKQIAAIACSVTYHTGTGTDRWRHTLTVSIAAPDAHPANNSAVSERRVVSP